MAKNAVRNPFSCPVIQRFVEDLEKTLASSPIILSSNIQKHFGPDKATVYFKSTLLFTDSSILELSVFANKSGKAVRIDKYRFHYMDNQGQMFFRYDNAPHHPGLPSFPDHKHTENRVLASTPPDVKNILNEISAIILKK